MKPALIVFILVSVLAGCSHTLVLTPQSSTKEFNLVKRQTSEWKGKVTLANGDRFIGEDFVIESDSIRWHEIEPELADALRATGFAVKSATQYQQPLWNVQQLQINNITRGMRDGIAFGFLLGFFIGTAVDLADPTASSTFALFPNTKYPTVRTVGGACLGASAGAVAGSLLTSHSLIKFLGFEK
jgi:hypothetical protein